MSLARERGRASRRAQAQPGAAGQGEAPVVEPNPAVQAQALPGQAAPLNIFVQARLAAGLTQAQVAERMGTLPPAITRLERSLLTGQHSPSLATLRKYAQACGKELVLHLS